jgi:hypothetical protein
MARPLRVQFSGALYHVTARRTEVCFRYRHRRGQQPPKWRTMTLPVEEFLDRLFEHVPVTGLHMVRAYGLYGAHEREALERCRCQLQPRWTQPPPAPERCRRCGAPLTVIVSRTPFPVRRPEKPTGPGPPVLARSNYRWSRRRVCGILPPVMTCMRVAARTLRRYAAREAARDPEQR